MMIKNLVIVESPAKAKTINKFLGKDFFVESCYGHIKDLPKKELGVDLKNNFKPTYKIIPGKEKIIKRLKGLSEKVSCIFLATDLDREGEIISWHLSQELNHQKKKVRITFNQITKKAILEAIKSPGEINLNKVEAQQGRRVLDRLVGYKISPLLWDKVKRGLSAGRVQSVAVRLICEQEEEINNFVPSEYWIVTAKFTSQNEKIEVEAKLNEIEGKKVKLHNENEVKKLGQKLEKEDYKIVRINKEKKERFPYPPFITSTLQQAAAFHLGFSPSKTMKIAQDLYEGQELGKEGRVGLITYMRTDSVRVAREAQLKARKYIKEIFGEKFLPEKLPHYKNKKSTQDAHEAIRPTEIFRTPHSLKEYLSPDHLRLYDLIWRRFCASQMEKEVYEVLKLKIQGGKFLFEAEGKKVIFEGFIKVYAERGEKERILPLFEIGTELKLKEIISKQHFTKPPSRYTEATLVKALEEKGIGRPSTYAPIIATIKKRGYVISHKGKLIPTFLAKVVNKLLVKNFSTILDTEFTARMEEGLDIVEEGKKKWTTLVDEFYKNFEKDLERAEKNMRNVKKEGVEEVEEFCAKCGGKMILRVGRFGEFLACSNYPRCKNTKNLDRNTGIKCPLPGCEGEIVEKVSNKGKVFYGCSKFPYCQFSLLEEPLKGSCPYCGNHYLIKERGRLKCPQCGKRVEEYETFEIKLRKVIHQIMRKRIGK